MSETEKLVCGRLNGTVVSAAPSEEKQAGVFQPFLPVVQTPSSHPRPDHSSGPKYSQQKASGCGWSFLHDPSIRRTVHFHGVPYSLPLSSLISSFIGFDQSRYTTGVKQSLLSSMMAAITDHSPPPKPAPSSGNPTRTTGPMRSMSMSPL